MGQEELQGAGPGKYVIYDNETSDNPRILRLFNLFVNGEFDKAMELYWELSPVHMRAMKTALYQSGGLVGIKYIDWLTGGTVVCLLGRRAVDYLSVPRMQ
jgi:hypothetical protein